MRPAGLLRSSILVLSLFHAVAGRGATLAERAAQIDAPARGAEVALSGPLQVGRAEIVPAAGTRVRALVAGGVACGLVFEGPAQLRYRVEDRFSAPVAERNVRRFSMLKATPLSQGIEEGGRRKLAVKLEQPMQFAVVTAGKYKVVEETQDGVTCGAATYAMLKEDAARKVIQKFFSARRFFEQRDAQDSWRLRYGKGPLVVHALRLELQRQMGSAAEGDRYFIALLRSYLKNNRYGWGTTHALVQELDKLTGGNWQPWFERYVYGTEIPRLPKEGP